MRRVKGVKVHFQIGDKVYYHKENLNGDLGERKEGKVVGKEGSSYSILFNGCTTNESWTEGAIMRHKLVLASNDNDNEIPAATTLASIAKPATINSKAASKKPVLEEEVAPPPFKKVKTFNGHLKVGDIILIDSVFMGDKVILTVIIEIITPKTFDSIDPVIWTASGDALYLNSRIRLIDRSKYPELEVPIGFIWQQYQHLMFNENNLPYQTTHLVSIKILKHPSNA